jgi:hypothetical protein
MKEVWEEVWQEWEEWVVNNQTHLLEVSEEWEVSVL